MARRELDPRDKVRRLLISLAIVVCLGGVVLGASQVRLIDPAGNEVPDAQDLADIEVTGDDDLVAEQPPGGADEGLPRAEIVEQTVPAEGAQILQQQQIGIDLGAAYRVSLLVVDRQLIAEENLIRRDELNQVFFQPGPGMEIEAFPPGRVCAVAEVVEAVSGERVRSVEWCFEVV